MISSATRQLIHRRLSVELGRLPTGGGRRVALVYPSPYAVAMSSLGFQAAYRLLAELPDIACERAFLPDSANQGAVLERPVSYESLSELGSFPLLAASVAYELELAGLVRMLQASGIAPERMARTDASPFVLVGGPITFGNPLPLAPFADAIVMGEAEQVLPDVLEAFGDATDRSELLDQLAAHPHVFVPARHGDAPPPLARCEDALLPACSCITTPEAELSDMFLVEVERGCSRACGYCVMRRTTNGGMRLVGRELILSKVPESARRVGLVGAAVSDHPRIAAIVRDLADSGRQVGLSSLRPDRLSDELVGELSRAGYKTLTTALDAPSARLRALVDRTPREGHYIDAAERCRRYGIERLKLYLMLGLPDETDEDIDECGRFIAELTRIVPVVLGVSPFCAKRNTPLDGRPFAGVRTVGARLDRLRRAVRGRAEVRATSARWAWVEHVLAQGGPEEGLAVARAVERGGRFADYRREFGELGHESDR
ncbi:MAG: radical SAM protein [Polyangiaceae bacterium]|nr:radical SAM protein [Polyangiaceae bacterium]